MNNELDFHIWIDWHFLGGLNFENLDHGDKHGLSSRTYIIYTLLDCFTECTTQERQ